MENELNEILEDAMNKKEKTVNEKKSPKDNGDITQNKSDDACPEWLPKKFWSNGEVNTKALAKSYSHLERKMSVNDDGVEDQSVEEKENTDNTTQDNTEQDEVHEHNNAMAEDTQPIDENIQKLINDSDFEKSLKEQGFEKEQMQSIYALAAKHLNPVIEQMQALNTRVMEQELEHHFGSRGNWHTAQENLQSWARANLPDETTLHLSSSVKGIKLMHNMMESSSEKPLKHTGEVGDSLTEDKLRGMMSDPRYWRTKDSAYIKKVQQGFQKLFKE